MLRARRLLVIAVLCLPIVVGGFILQSRAGGQAQRGNVLSDVVNLIRERYVDTLSESAVFEKAARGLVKELNDPYSELITPQEWKQMNARIGGVYAGLGMQIEDQKGNITVSRVYPNTPAERGGVREGDRIIKVDTLSTRGWTTRQVSDYLVGKEGDSVSATFSRPGVAEPIPMRFRRAIIRIPAVPYVLTFDGAIGYIPLQTFNENSTNEARAAIDTLTRSGAKGLVLDLRGNPGGLLDQSISISNLFLDRGLRVVSVRGREGAGRDSLTTQSAVLPSLPMIVLTDEFAASASEIVSGALQDHDRALILGQTTFGKGLVQSLFTLPGGWVLKITTAKWFTPSGRSIQRDRKIVNGEFVEDTPDSNETEASKRARPAFKSDMGRVVYGGGGVTPDLIVPDDTLTTVEQQFVKAIAPKAQDFYLVLYDYGLELSKSATPGFTVQPAWRDEFFKRLNARGAGIDRQQFDAAQRHIDRQLEQRIARFVVADSGAKRRDIANDAPLRRALELLKTGKSQRELFTLIPSGIRGSK
jgi:carboxyl-terminal processing protease